MQQSLRVERLYKVFGHPDPASLELLEEGVTKDDFQERTGLHVGVIDANFTVRKGETFVIMGLSGSGKSTLIRLINRLLDPSSGRIWLDDREITGLSPKEMVRLRRQEMAMVFQSFALLPNRSVLENVTLGLEINGIAKQRRRDKGMQALTQVGLQSYASALPSELSGGMQQRVGLARALATEAPLLLMDEAFSALDPLIRREMQEELLQLKGERTILFISHDLDEAFHIGDRIAIMEAGRIIQIGDGYEVLNNPKDQYVRRFFKDLDTAKVLRASDIVIQHEPYMVDLQSNDLEPLLRELSNTNSNYAYIVNSERRYQGIVSAEKLQSLANQDGHMIRDAMIDGVKTIEAKTKVATFASQLAQAPYPLPVLNSQGRWEGILTPRQLLLKLYRKEEQD